MPTHNDKAKSEKERKRWAIRTKNGRCEERAGRDGESERKRLMAKERDSKRRKEVAGDEVRGRQRRRRGLC